MIRNGDEINQSISKGDSYTDAKCTKVLPIKLPLKDAQRFEQLAKIISDNSWGLTLIRLMDNFEKDYKYTLLCDALESIDKRVAQIEVGMTPKEVGDGFKSIGGNRQ
jgi:hypothetical protein